jgi:hypothetical protein
MTRAIVIEDRNALLRTIEDFERTVAEFQSNNVVLATTVPIASPGFGRAVAAASGAARSTRDNSLRTNARLSLRVGQHGRRAAGVRCRHRWRTQEMGCVADCAVGAGVCWQERLA